MNNKDAMVAFIEFSTLLSLAEEEIPVNLITLVVCRITRACRIVANLLTFILLLKVSKFMLGYLELRFAWNLDAKAPFDCKAKFNRLLALLAFVDENTTSWPSTVVPETEVVADNICLLYTSDAADE